MNERLIELVSRADENFQLALVPAEIVEKFAALIQTECMAICEATKADYMKNRKAAFEFEEKEIFAEGEAASDTIKYQIAYLFGPK